MKKNENAPFQLFISGYRRMQILNSMMGETDEEKKAGEKILENYKKQLADRMAREKIDLQALSSTNSVGKSNAKRSNKD